MERLASVSARRRLRIVMLIGGLLSCMEGLAMDSPRPPFADIAGIAIGERPDTAAWLTPSTPRQRACPGETHYQANDVNRRLSIAGVQLAWPGLVYKAYGGRLYAVEGVLPANSQAFPKLLDNLTRRFGQPDVFENWAGSPTDSFTFQQRLRVAGWFDRETRQSLWLAGHDEGGSFTLTRRWDRLSEFGQDCEEPASSLADSTAD